MTWLHDLGWTYKSDIRQGAGSLYQRTHSSVDHAGVGFINALSTGLEGRDGADRVTSHDRPRNC